MIVGLSDYFNLLCEKGEKIRPDEVDYLSVLDTIEWCKDLWNAIDILPNKKDTRQELLEAKESARKKARITNDVSELVDYRKFDDLIFKYDFLQRAVIEQKYL